MAMRNRPDLPSPPLSPPHAVITRKAVPRDSIALSPTSDPRSPPATTTSLLGTETQPTSKVDTKQRRSRHHLTWIFEAGSFALALGLLAATIAVLISYQDKPLPKWPSYISINSLIAIFSAILKASLTYPIAEGISELKWVWFARAQPASDLDRFDAASRGPWGSLLLLLKRPGNLMTSLGAAIMILALAIDPFTQQVIRYRTCAVTDSGATGTVPRTNRYTAAGGRIGAARFNPDPALMLSLYEGLLNPPTNMSSSIQIDCPSGNCTLVEKDGIAYRSLAICHKVTDISHLIDSTESQYSIKTDLVLNRTGTQEDISYLVTSPLAYTETGDYDQNATFTFSVLMDLKSCPGDLETECTGGDTPWAFTAGLYPCVISYSGVTISENVLQETVVDRTFITPTIASGGPNYTLAGNYPSLPDTDCSPSPQGDYDPACIYEFGLFTYDSLQFAVSSFFGTSQNAIVAMDDFFAGPLWLLRLYANATTTLDSATKYVEGLANSMTAVIRNQGDPSNSKPAQSVVTTTETCVSVNWAWLALPTGLILLTFIFLCAMIAQSRHTRHKDMHGMRQPWKSSSLPLLFCGLPDAVRDHYGAVNEVRQMKIHGDDLELRLRRAGAWGVPQDFSSKEERAPRWVMAQDSPTAL